MLLNDGRVVTTSSSSVEGEDITIYGKGTQTRSFCYVDDLIEGMERMMDAENFTGPVNLGNPEEYTILELRRRSSQPNRDRRCPQAASFRRPDAAARYHAQTKAGVGTRCFGDQRLTENYRIFQKGIVPLGRLRRPLLCLRGMIMDKTRASIIAVIPARYGSTRFPGKALALIKDKPMIRWVYERTQRSRLVDRVVVATDDERIRQVITAFGGDAVMTSPEHPTGTDRVSEVAEQTRLRYRVMSRGDEPLIHPDDRSGYFHFWMIIVPMGTLFPKSTSGKKLSTGGQVVSWGCLARPFRDRDHWSENSFTELSSLAPCISILACHVYRRFSLAYAKMPQTPLEARKQNLARSIRIPDQAV
jgi:3-deoxy-manno-octulosonate cytidylyltransferase (CMP-KDO synthetase)